MTVLRDNDVDHSTRRHLARMNTSTWYALALKVTDSDYRTKIKQELDNLLGSNSTTGIEGEVVYAVKPLSNKELTRVKNYLESQREHIDAPKILKSDEYGPFVGNPKYWLRDYAGFS